MLLAKITHSSKLHPYLIQQLTLTKTKVMLPFKLSLFLLLVFLKPSSTKRKDTPVAGSIVGGRKAAHHQFPFQLSLQHQKRHICGASLWNSSHALTAAHCCDVITRGDFKVGDMQVVGGEHELFTQSGHEQISYLGQYFQHPGFKMEGEWIAKFTKYKPVRKLVELIREWGLMSSPLHFDICILQLKEPFNLTSSIQPIFVGESTPKFGTMCTISGWGYAGDSPVVNTLNYADVPILDDIDCQAPYGAATFDSDTMICAGYEQGVIDSCQGDSGGPLVCNDALIGIVSFGEGCGNPGYPGVYTKVSAFHDWLHSNMNATQPAPTFKNGSIQLTCSHLLLLVFSISNLTFE